MASNTIIKGKKINLRPLSLKDAPKFCGWMADPEVTVFLSMYDQPPPTLKEEREWIRQRQKDKDSLTMAIETKEGVLIGTVSLRNIRKKSKRARFGIVIGDKKYWGQGLGTEVTQLMVKHGFIELKLNRIFLEHIAYNERGHRAYAQAGFVQEGRFRQHLFRNGYYHDVVWMGMLREDYLKKEKRKKKK